MVRLDEWLCRSAKIAGFKTRSKTKTRIKKGCVQVNGRVVSRPATKLKVGDSVQISIANTWHGKTTTRTWDLLVIAQLQGDTFGCKQLSIGDSAPKPVSYINSSTAHATPQLGSYQSLCLAQKNENYAVAIQKAPAMKYRKRAKHLLASPIAKHFDSPMLSKDDIYALTCRFVSNKPGDTSASSLLQEGRSRAHLLANLYVDLDAGQLDPAKAQHFRTAIIYGEKSARDLETAITSSIAQFRKSCGVGLPPLLLSLLRAAMSTISGLMGVRDATLLACSCRHMRIVVGDRLAVSLWVPPRSHNPSRMGMAQQTSNMVNYAKAFMHGEQITSAQSTRARRATHLYFRQLNLSTTDGILHAIIQQCLRGRSSFARPLGTLDLSFCARLSEGGILKAARALASALTNLSLRGCTQIRDVTLEQLLRLLPRLRCLDLRGCYGLSGSGAQAIEIVRRGCTFLEGFWWGSAGAKPDIDFDVDEATDTDIARFRSAVSGPTDASLLELAHACGSRLRALEIETIQTIDTNRRYVPQVTPEGIHAVLRECPVLDFCVWWDVKWQEEELAALIQHFRSRIKRVVLGDIYHVRESMVAVLPNREDFSCPDKTFLDVVQTWMDDVERWGVSALDTVAPGTDLTLVLGRNVVLDESMPMPPMKQIISMLQQKLPTNSLRGLSLGSPVLDQLEYDPEMSARLCGFVEHHSQSLTHLHIGPHPQRLQSVFTTLRLVLPRAPSLVRVATHHKQNKLYREGDVERFLDSLARDVFTLMAAHSPLIRDVRFNVDLQCNLSWPREYALTHLGSETEKSVRLVMQRLQSYAGLPPTVQCWSEFLSLAESLNTDYNYVLVSLPSGTFSTQCVTEEVMASALARAEEWVEQLRSVESGSTAEQDVELLGWDTVDRAAEHAKEGVQVCKRVISLRSRFVDATKGRSFDVDWSTSCNALRWFSPTYGLTRIQHVRVQPCETLMSLSSCLNALAQLPPGLITVTIDMHNLKFGRKKERGIASTFVDSLLALVQCHGKTLREIEIIQNYPLTALTADVWIGVVAHCPRLHRLIHGIIVIGSGRKHSSSSIAMRQFVRGLARVSPWLAHIDGSFCHDGVHVSCSMDVSVLAMLPRLRGFYTVNVDFYRGLCY